MTITRDDEIKDAFRFAIKRDPAGRFTVTTADFVSEPERLNWHYTKGSQQRDRRSQVSLPGYFNIGM